MPSVTTPALESALAKLRTQAAAPDWPVPARITSQEAAALLAKLEAADRLVEAAESQAADLGHTDTYLLDCAASYRNPQPTKIKPPCDLCEGTGVAVDYELGRSIGCPRGCSRTPQPTGGGE